ncbi:MAG: hypothetical protein KBF89_06255 [Acidimicrobiia bacterium]|nr:hypothetical protein [Acidimicrobiia bacterium]
MNFDIKGIEDDPCGPGSDCEKILEIVNKYIDGCADDDETLLITTHTQDCIVCRDGIVFEEKFRARIKSVKPECMPQDLKNKMLMSFGFPGMNELPSALSNEKHNNKHHFFKFFRKNDHTG